MSEYDLPVPDDALWLNLSKKEIEELRKQKYELSQYGKQKIKELMNDGKLRFYDKGKETFAVEDPYWGGCKSPETQLHIKEMTDPITAKVSKEDFEKVMDAAERQELINEALEELNAIVLGGQNTREFYLSVSHIRNVLERLK